MSEAVSEQIRALKYKAGPIRGSLMVRDADEVIEAAAALAQSREAELAKQLAEAEDHAEAASQIAAGHLQRYTREAELVDAITAILERAGVPGDSLPDRVEALVEKVEALEAKTIDSFAQLESYMRQNPQFCQTLTNIRVLLAQTEEKPVEVQLREELTSLRARHAELLGLLGEAKQLFERYASNEGDCLPIDEIDEFIPKLAAQQEKADG